jgi:hypothetical protein
LPGIEFLDTQAEKSLTYKPVYLGIQKGETVIEAVPANRKRVVFEPVFRVAPLAGGKTNFLGPYAKGTPSARFFYLSWVVKGEGGDLTMFRRFKVDLSHLTWPQVENAARSGKPLIVNLSMTDQRGGPVCGSDRRGHVRWED